MNSINKKVVREIRDNLSYGFGVCDCCFKEGRVYNFTFQKKEFIMCFNFFNYLSDRGGLSAYVQYVASVKKIMKGLVK